MLMDKFFLILVKIVVIGIGKYRIAGYENR